CCNITISKSLEKTGDMRKHEIYKAQLWFAAEIHIRTSGLFYQSGYKQGNIFKPEYALRVL
ncbi:MAG: hypothetical protein WAK60_11340, partial [Sedimentisphaerales bacterium]